MLRKLFAVLVVVLFIILFLPFRLLIGAYATLTDENFYKEDVAGFAYEFLHEKIPENVKLQDFPSINGEDLRDLFEKVFTEEDFSLIAADVFAQLKNPAKTKEGFVLKLQADKLRVKEELMVKELAALLYQKLPRCVDEKTNQSVGGFDYKNQCIPENLSEIDFEAMVKTTLDREVFVHLPGQYMFEIADSDKMPDNVLQKFNSAFSSVFVVVLGLLIFLLAILAMIVRRSWKKILMWEGAALFLASNALVLLSIFASFGFFYEILNQALVNMGLTTPLQIDFVSRLFFVFIHNVFGHFASLDLILMAVGFVSWITFGILSAGSVNEPLKISKKSVLQK